MAITNNQQLFPDLIEVKPSQGFRSSLTKYLFHWPLFLFSLLIAFALAAVYIYRQQPVYHVNAKLVIEEEAKSLDAGKESSSGLSLSTKPKKAESEIEKLKSLQLIKAVVDELQLWATYTMKAGLKNEDIYESTPVHFNWIAKGPYKADYTMQITVLDGNRFALLTADSKKYYNFNQPVQSKYGTWTLKPTPELMNYQGKSVTIHLSNPAQTANYYQSAISAVLSKTAPIIELSINDEVPERSVKILNTLIADYQKFNLAEKNGETQNTLTFIDARLASLSNELLNVEKSVAGYKSSIGLTDISSKSQFYLNNVQANDSKLNDVDVQLDVIRNLEAYVNNSHHSAVAPATTGTSDPGLNSLVEMLSKLQLQREQLLATTPETNPLFEPINKQIQSTKHAIKEKVYGIRAALEVTKRQLMGNSNNYESSIKSIPGQEREYLSIKRQQSIKENLYVYLLQKREEVGLSYASTIPDASVLESANYNEPKSNKEFPLAFALIFGLAFPAGYVYLRDASKNRIITKTEIENLTFLPIISELEQTKSNNPLVVLGNKPTVIGEQFRSLRTNLQLIGNNNAITARTTLLTSSVSGEGKSFITSNLAVLLAAAGKKTIILEFDLRKPQISKLFDINASKPGLSSYLTGYATADEIVQVTNINPLLHIMPAGLVPNNPSELISNKLTRDLINYLSKSYDEILIDSPPIHLVTDAMILAPLCDNTLYVIRQGYTGKNELTFIKDLYKNQRLPNLHLVFNGIERKKNGYGYNYDSSYYHYNDTSVMNVKGL